MMWWFRAHGFEGLGLQMVKGLGYTVLGAGPQ